jgi:uncharacterized protein YqhQ
LVKHYLGGQALIEGVMIKNKDQISIAVRKENGKIVTKKEKIKFKETKIPFVRGIVNLFIMMYIGIRALNYSTNIATDSEEESSWFYSFLSLLFAFVFAIVLFKFVPLGITTIVNKYLGFNNILFNIVDGALKIGIFLGYVYILSFMKDVYRVFQYHGAEHQAVACYEHGHKLTVDNVAKFNKEHPRCGTNFIFLTLLVSIFVYTFIPQDFNFWSKLGLRVVLLPLIASVSYELLRISAKVKVLSFIGYPGLLIQKITTKKPEKDQIEVAIKAVKTALH